MEESKINRIKDASDKQFLPLFSMASGKGMKAFPRVYSYTNQIVNICFVENNERPDEWVLIDTGMPASTNKILEVIEARYGKENPPQAILLTHGHFDHIGAAIDLAEKWDINVYAHEKELPYLTGETSYPEPDGTVEGGLVAKISPMFSVTPIDLGNRVKELPADGTVPHLPGWTWLHTPGHSPGHVSFFRESDRMLIVGDTFVTVKQDSLYKVLTQELEITGPPRYLTTDWDAARESVKKLAALKPSMAVTGHGKPVSNATLQEGLERLVLQFDQIAIPDYGRYIKHR